MPQQKQEKVVNTFVKGLITEAGELTFPPDASVDELNCDLRRDGSRRRRKAVTYETSYELSSFDVTTMGVFHTGEWLNVGGQNGLDFLVIQNGSTLQFYDKVSRPYSSQEIAESIDLSLYQTATGGGAGYSKCSFTSIRGALIVASPSIDTIRIERDNLTGVLTVTTISFRVRDFEWLSSLSAFGSEVASPSIERQYDTKNAGWTGNGDAARTTYISTRSAWPPLTHPWYSGKNSSGSFSVSEWRNIGTGTSITGNGLYILDFFNKDRAVASGIVGLATDVETSRFSTVASFAGRVFYAGLDSDRNAGTLLFSQIIISLNDLGECLQKNDPTSEFLSDLLDTDGGVIEIPDCVGIRKLHAFGNSLFVFAKNGVWRISGVDDVFRATGYAVTKMTEVGIQSALSFVSVDGVPFWWSQYGIHSVSFDSVNGDPREVNLSLSTIQSFWDEIGLDPKSRAISAYDNINKRIFWFYPNEDETNRNKYNKVLVLDVALQAFYPWTISDQAANSSYIVGATFYSGYGASSFEDTVIVGPDVVQVSAVDVIVNTVIEYATGDTAIVLLVADGASGNMTMAGFSSDTFLDWGDADYSSYAEAGYDFMNSVELRKSLPFITVFCGRTEDAWTGNDSTGYNLSNPSSLYVSGFWDFKSTPSSTAQQAYRLKYVPFPAPPVFDYPHSVVTTRLKIRGRGRSLKLKFEGESGKDFVLLGYGMIQGVNSTF